MNTDEVWLAAQFGRASLGDVAFLHKCTKKFLQINNLQASTSRNWKFEKFPRLVLRNLLILNKFFVQKSPGV